MSYDYSGNLDAAGAAAMAGFSTAYILLSLVVSVVVIIGMWKVFTKAGKPGWASIIPIYNAYTLFDIAMGNGLLFLLMLVPCVNVVMMFVCLWKLGKAFGKDTGFCIGLVLLSGIFMIILGFDSSEYVGSNRF
ncbi:MAG: DUF5684 domain-containing protein [Lachnospiraceae bacterium]|nr:DUF5684 domain-containing protein [Lachnospiraceae bacterium]